MDLISTGVELERSYLPRQLSDLERLLLVICGGEISQVPEIVNDAIREWRAESAKLLWRNILLATSNEISVVLSREVSVELPIQICIWPLPVSREAVEVKVNELSDSLPIFASHAVNNLCQE